MHRSLIITLAALVAIPSTAAANMRAPTQQDGDVVVTALETEATDAITLTHEALTIRAPRLRDKEWDAHVADIEAVYTLENSGPAATLHLVFLATAIDEPTVSVNGAAIGAPATIPMNDAQRAELQAARDRLPQPAHGRRGYRDSPGTARFSVALQPGSNVVAFRYRQHVAFDENDTRYGAPVHEHSEARIDYLLYPARSWRRADGFRLDVRVVVPDLVREGWFWDTHWAPQLDTSLPLDAAYDRKKKQTTLSGSFDEFPIDVLSVTIRRGKKR